MRPFSVFMRCNIRLALALGSEDVSDSAVCDDMGDIERLPAVSAGAYTGEPSEDIEGADGGEVATAGTDAK